MKNLEINLVKVPNIYSQMGRSLSRKRYLVENDTEALSKIMEFIRDCSTDLIAITNDEAFITRIKSSDSLTIVEFNCIRYFLARKGVDLWVSYVSESESNPAGIPDNSVEYNVLDYSMMSSQFIPMAAKITQLESEMTLTKVYKSINESFGLFTGNRFVGSNNPVSIMIQNMESSDRILGSIPKGQTEFLNSLMEFLGIRIRVLTH